MIAALGENNSLGKNNDLLWHLPDDFRRFKQFTSGHKIIMGRKTFQSFPKPLSNRTHIVISRDPNYQINLPLCVVVNSLEDALDLVSEDELSFIIGGGEIYKLAMPYADILELTRVHESFEADTFFPTVDLKQWELIKEEYHPKDDRHAYDFSYRTYIRVRNNK
ncbi:dihydrofolate reductase [Eudoraea chungangensis]|uniref:dihydrofolate reductase n=1 Tax=Eudoraea chungangensis TaxID=1481905 RepID=UPI0023ED7EA5|nr:dihydrofolate reductase [Eudoraea chungangensis]